MFEGLKRVWDRIMTNKKYYQSYFVPKNPKKCTNVRRGQQIFARSSWETRMFNWLDLNENVLEWGSEIVKVPYIFDVDQKLHNYIPDILCRIKENDNKIQVYLLEIKPQKQTQPPKVPRNKTKKAVKNYAYAKQQYIQNQNKWKYAKSFCEGKKWKFRLVTEQNLF